MEEGDLQGRPAAGEQASTRVNAKTPRGSKHGLFYKKQQFELELASRLSTIASPSPGFSGSIGRGKRSLFSQATTCPRLVAVFRLSLEVAAARC